MGLRLGAPTACCMWSSELAQALVPARVPKRLVPLLALAPEASPELVLEPVPV